MFKSMIYVCIIMANQHNVTLPPDLEKFLVENKLSPTKLLQSKLLELQEGYNISPEKMKMFIQQRDRIMLNLQDAMEFIISKGLLDEFDKRYPKNE